MTSAPTRVERIDAAVHVWNLLCFDNEEPPPDGQPATEFGLVADKELKTLVLSSAASRRAASTLVFDMLDGSEFYDAAADIERIAGSQLWKLVKLDHLEGCGIETEDRLDALIYWLDPDFETEWEQGDSE